MASISQQKIKCP